jgi:Flp pilus assembly secretin CpaC
MSILSAIKLQKLMRPDLIRPLMLALTLTVTAAEADQDLLAVTLDQAKMVRIPAGTQTLIIGNPIIADVTMLKNVGMMVVTGKSFGQTNLIALDNSGNQGRRVDDSGERGIRRDDHGLSRHGSRIL